MSLWPVILVVLAVGLDTLTLWSVKADLRRQGYAHLDMRVVGIDLILTITALIACWFWWRESHTPTKGVQRRNSDKR